MLKLQNEGNNPRLSIRWELGACWVQHLQNQASEKTETKKTEEAKTEPSVKGLGKHGGLLKEIKKKTDKSIYTDQRKENSAPSGSDLYNKSDIGVEKESVKHDSEKDVMLRTLIPEAAFLRLKESETGLHLKVCVAFNFEMEICLISILKSFLLSH